MFQAEASKSHFQSGSLKFSASGSSRATTDNFNQSLHLPPAAPVYVDMSPGRMLERDASGGGRYSSNRLAMGDAEDGGWDVWMSSHHNERVQTARGPVLDVSYHGKLILSFIYSQVCLMKLKTSAHLNCIHVLHVADINITAHVNC